MGLLKANKWKEEFLIAIPSQEGKYFSIIDKPVITSQVKLHNHMNVQKHFYLNKHIIKRINMPSITGSSLFYINET